MEVHQTRPLILTARLYDAALIGDVNCLKNLLHEDPLILDRCILEKSDRFVHSPLYVAANLGHLDFTKEILERKPELTEELNQFMRSSSALHMAVIKGHLDIVKVLVKKNTNICFANDQDGRNPVHVAAIRGKTDELNVLVSANPQAARERTSAGDTILHLCVKHTQASALELLVNNANDDCNMLNAKDNDGNTVLHLAVLAEQLKMVELLLKQPKLEQNALNESGFTAMDVINQSKRGNCKDAIWKALKRKRACRAKYIRIQKDEGINSKNWLERQRNALMVVASLIATMAFQVGVNPPGGAWQDEKLSPDPSQPSDTFGVRDIHIGGTSIMATLDKGQYNKLLISNTIGFLASLSVILLLISGLPCQRFFVILLMLVMWIAISATTVTYLLSVVFLSITIDNGSNRRTLYVVVCVASVWLGLIMILSFVHGIRAVRRLSYRWIFKPIIKRMKMTIKSCASVFIKGTSATHPPV